MRKKISLNYRNQAEIEWEVKEIYTKIWGPMIERHAWQASVIQKKKNVNYWFFVYFFVEMCPQSATASHAVLLYE